MLKDNCGLELDGTCDCEVLDVEYRDEDAADADEDATLLPPYGLCLACLRFGIAIEDDMA